MTAMFSDGGAEVVPRLRQAVSHWQKFRGLMMDRSLQSDEALLIHNCRSIHCFFMLMPIDVVFLAADGTIVRVIERMKPWTVSPVVRQAQDVLECYPGTIAAHGLQVGHRLRMSPPA